MERNLLSYHQHVLCSAAAAAATTDLDGTVIDMAQGEGYDGILLIAQLGDVLTTSVLDLYLQGSDNADGSGSAKLAGIGPRTAGATDCDNGLLVLDVRGPTNRYVFSRLKRGTANAVVNSIIAILYRARKVPVTQGASVVGSAFVPLLGDG